MEVEVGVYETMHEAQRAGEAFSPPVWQENDKSSKCALCGSTFGMFLKRRHHCRNCGRLVCGSCVEMQWPSTMLPQTFMVDSGEKKVRVCETCHETQEAFRSALLKGDEEETMKAFSTGCINLRTPYTIYHNEV
ncbi:unnamed protein product, partial [Discosporangium mesarthrocarpum]